MIATQVNTGKLISVLNTLIESCKDGEKGFREASEGVKSYYYQIRLREYSRHRSMFSNELQGIVRKLGGDADCKGSLGGSIHRGWLNLKAIVARGRDEGVLAECCRGEQIALGHYEEAFLLDIPEPILSVVERQHSVIRETLLHLHAMLSVPPPPN